MLISYNWLKQYLPEIPTPEKLADIFNYHICEVETIEKKNDDTVLDIKILPNRAHDLLSHQGIARELASLLDIQFIDPIPKYKILKSHPTKLIKTIESPKCRRYMGRVIRNIKVGPAPEWMVKYLESVGQRSINNIVDATNIVMFDCGQPTHVFDLAKVKDLKLKVRNAEDGEKMTLLGGEEKTLDNTMMVIADDYGHTLDIAGIKGGKYAELTPETTDIILEAANFDPVSVRKTAQALNIVTDAKKRFENDLSPTLDPLGILELSALIFEMCPKAMFEDIVDVYPKEQEERKLLFSAQKISSILGAEVSANEIEKILKRYHFKYKEKNGRFEIIVPSLRLDLEIEEDMAEEIGRILGYDKIKGKIPKINFPPKVNETYAKAVYARNKLLEEGYSEVMNSSFRDKGEIEVLKSASDKNFLRANLSDGLKESIKLNQANVPILGIDKVKVFEVGTVFYPSSSLRSDLKGAQGPTFESMHVAYGDKKGIKEMKLEEYVRSALLDASAQVLGSPGPQPRPDHSHKHTSSAFKMWSLFPFIARDIAVWVPENVKSSEVLEIIKDNAGELVVRGPELFDEFKKDNKISYAFRTVFQSFNHTLTDAEINEIMQKITKKITENKDWEVR